MEDEEQEALFGAIRGKIVTAQISVYTNVDGERWQVNLAIFEITRKQPVILRVVCNDDQGIDAIIGPMSAILMKVYYCRFETIAGKLLSHEAMFNQAGYEARVIGLKRR